MKKMSETAMRMISAGGIKCTQSGCGKTFSGALGWAAAAYHIIKTGHWSIEFT